VAGGLAVHGDPFSGAWQDTSNGYPGYLEIVRRDGGAYQVAFVNGDKRYPFPLAQREGYTLVIPMTTHAVGDLEANAPIKVEYQRLSGDLLLVDGQTKTKFVRAADLPNPQPAVPLAPASSPSQAGDPSK
jgi:hypothetical protein